MPSHDRDLAVRFRVKIVPDESPNAQGEWIVIDVPMSPISEALYKGLHQRERWDLYDANVPTGHHVVAVDS